MAGQAVEVQRWTQAEIPSEERVRQQMRAEGLIPAAWQNGPGDRYDPHAHSYHKVLYVVGGSIQFTLPNHGQQLELAVGDRLDLPPGVVHEAQVGPDGVVCLEAHR